MSISIAALQGSPTDDTISLLISIGDIQAISLIDSGSSSTFIDYDFVIKKNLPVRNTTAQIQSKFCRCFEYKSNGFKFVFIYDCIDCWSVLENYAIYLEDIYFLVWTV
jgi:hypothetical protein